MRACDIAGRAGDDAPDDEADSGTGIRPADPRLEARLMRGLRFTDDPAARVADRRGRRVRLPPTHVHAESVMAAL